MSIPFSQGKLQGKERKHVLQAVQEQAKAAARAAIRPVLQEFLETEVCAKLGREKEKHGTSVASCARSTGSVGTADVGMPTSSRATAIIAGVSQRVGGISAICASPCWSANSVSMMWLPSLPS